MGAFAIAPQFQIRSRKISFFNKIKQAVGIGMVQVSLTAPPEISRNSGVVPIEIILTAPAPQTIQSITIKLVEEFTTWKGEDQETQKVALGQVRHDARFEMRAGETQALRFDLPFNFQLAPSYKIAARSGILGAAGKVLSKLNQDRAAHFIAASIDVQGAARDANVRKPIRLV